MVTKENKKYFQSTSGFILELEEGKVPKRLNLGEVEKLELPEDIITNKKGFYTAYLDEIMALKKLHQELKKKVKEEEDKKNEGVFFDEKGEKK